VVPPGTAGTATVVVTTPAGSASTTYTYVAAASVAFADTFNDGDASGWAVSPLGLAGAWTVTGGALGFSGIGHTQLVLGGSGWADYSVEVTYRLSSLANFPGGLRGRVDPATGAGYEAWLSPGTGQVILYRVTGWSLDGDGLTWLGAAPVTFDATGRHRLKLAFQGSQITVYHDGVQRIQVTDATRATGTVALDVSNQPVQFDDVLVLRLPAVAPALEWISPPAGTAAGGTLLHVAGSGFVPGTTVTVGGVAATSVTVPSPTRLTAIVPAGTVGPATVTVTAPGGSASLPYTFVAPARILLADDFNDGNTAGWTVSPLGNAGGFTVADGAVQYSGIGHTQLVAGQGGWTNYSAQVRIRLSTLDNAPGGLRGRVNLATGAGYEAWLLPASGEVRLYRVTGWSIDSPGLTLLATAPVVLRATGLHALGLVFQGTSIGVVLDDNLVIAVTDATYAAGGVALDVSNQVVRLDDVLVLLPTPAPPPSGTLAVVTASPLPAGTATAAYRLAFAATGGSSPYTWSLAPGSSLPAGLVLSSGGVLSGFPGAGGTSSFTVRVSDGAAATATKAFSLTVAANTAPTSVQVLAPTAGQTVGGIVTLQARATDGSGTVARVEFFLDAGAAPICTDAVARPSAATFQCAWNSAAAASGAHTVRARAYDAGGLFLDSAAVAFSVTHTVVLTIAVSGCGTGQVTGDAGGLACTGTGTCTATVPIGTAVHLTARPDPASRFVAWSGACSGTATTCTVAVTTAVTATAGFERVFVDPTLLGVPVRAVHLADLRASIGVLRQRHALSPFAWTDVAVTPGGTAIKRLHVVELRAALAAVYAAAGRAAPTYTDPDIGANSTPVRAIHFTELRAAALAIE
jgi:hypothetical protein